MASTLELVTLHEGPARRRGSTWSPLPPCPASVAPVSDCGHRSSGWTSRYRPCPSAVAGTRVRRRRRPSSSGVRALTAATLLLCLAAAGADEPVAIVESASADAPVAQFSYLSTGQVISLGANAEVQIGYLHSCVLERVRAGVVTIGRERSDVVGGERTERILDCRGATAELTPSEIERGAALVMREPVSVTPQVRIVSTSPVIAPKGPATSVTLKRLDGSESATTLALRNGAADLAAQGVALRRGGIYRIEAGASSVIVEIAADAQSDGGAVLLRLLSF